MIVRENIPNYIEHTPKSYNDITEFLGSDFWKDYNKRIYDIELIPSDKYFGSNNHNPNWLILLVKTILTDKKLRIARLEIESDYDTTEYSTEFLDSLMILKCACIKTNEYIKEYKEKYK